MDDNSNESRWDTFMRDNWPAPACCANCGDTKPGNGLRCQKCKAPMARGSRNLTGANIGGTDGIEVVGEGYTDPAKRYYK